MNIKKLSSFLFQRSVIVALLIGIATRWRFVFGEIGDAFRNIFAR